MKQCPTCTAPVETMNGNESHFSYKAPRAIDLNEVKLHAVEDFAKTVEYRFKTRPTRGFVKILHEELLSLRRLVANERG